jgi:hypothetical protein
MCGARILRLIQCTWHVNTWPRLAAGCHPNYAKYHHQQQHHSQVCALHAHCVEVGVGLEADAGSSCIHTPLHPAGHSTPKHSTAQQTWSEHGAAQHSMPLSAEAATVWRKAADWWQHHGLVVAGLIICSCMCCCCMRLVRYVRCNCWLVTRETTGEPLYNHRACAHHSP